MKFSTSIESVLSKVTSGKSSTCASPTRNRTCSLRIRGRIRNEHVRFLVGDAQVLDFPDVTFDKTLSMLVLNFIPDRDRAVREMIRVTKPNGVVAAAVWDYGDDMEMLRVFWQTAVALDSAAAAR